VFDQLATLDELPQPAWRALGLRDAHLRAVDPVLSFLQGRDSGLAPRILETPFLPIGPALEEADLSAFGEMGTVDAARHLATLYLQDLVHLVGLLDPGFGLARYQSHLAQGVRSFDPLYERLQQTTLVDELLDALTDTLTAPVVGLSVPFPGNLYGALRIGKRLKARGVTVFLGGGYVNTELRDLDEPRIWDFVDALSYDDGEGPLLALLEHLEGGEDRRHRTRTASGSHNAPFPRPPFTPAGNYGDLDLSQYLQLIDTLNPAHRLWADGRWNKITLAHGCYWRKCSFCDVNLDYISHYENLSVVTLVDHMERLIEQTGQRGFHFVDEAAPPKVLKALALELLSRNLGVTLWGNIRFERAFTPDVARLLAAAGVVAVTGGLEVANTRLLKAIRKGVTVEQVARAAYAFRSAGVMVHAYLMYGFPSQTADETLDSMELVRQLFELGLVNSAFWHRFVLTRHAPIFQQPKSFGLRIPDPGETRFAANDVPHIDLSGADPDAFDDALPLALDAWLQGRELQRPVHTWFEDLPPTREPPDRIERALDSPSKTGNRAVWLGGQVLGEPDGLLLHQVDATAFIPCNEPIRDWLIELLEAARPGLPPVDIRLAIDRFPGDWGEFGSAWAEVRELGCVLI